MKRIKLLLENKDYRAMLSRIAEAEKERIFCRHDLTHFFDVARLLYIYALEDGLDIDKELIYAIGLLHDIGRAAQYESGEEHHTASARAVERLMPLCGFDADETQAAANAILMHRNGGGDALAQLVYRADKRSRLCFACDARAKCNWPADKMNLEPEI
ncbi:MAG: HD domain-containing protein [Firmicutes bacterium]|nr:HD domain-containing protein [Bacillota bacterium]